MNLLPNRLLAVLLLGLLIAGTSWLPARAQTPPVSANHDKIALVMKALSNPFFAKMEGGAKDYARDNHLVLEVFGTEMETDIEHQTGIINNLTARGYGAIVIAPADSRKLTPALKKAVDQGIVVINIDNPLDQDTQAQNGLAIPFVGADNAKGAALVGDYVRQQLRGKGRILVIEGISGARNSELRKMGFLQAVTAAGGVELLESVSANWHTEDAFTRMSGLLEKYGPVDAVFCANDQMALGVLQALDLRNLTGKVLVVGYDDIEAARNELRNGRMHATVEQHPEQMGRYGVALAHQAMQGEKIPATQETPLDLITYETFGKRIALALSDLSNPFFVALLAGARSQAELHGIDLLFADASNDDAQQLVALQDFVRQRVDALIVNPTNAQAVRPGIELANRAAVPVITVDRAADGGQVVAHIASDNVAGGRLAAEYIARQLSAGGTIAELEGIPGASASHERGQGFNDAIAHHKSLRITAREVANFNRDEARDAVQRLLAQGQTFDAIFAHNDRMILGAMDALQKTPTAQPPLLIGFDAIPEARQALREGKITATVAQNPERMGALAVDVATRILRNEPVPATIAVELDLLEAPGK